ncbi:patatin-like phospholipase family protein [Georgenia alba]|uniref:Patatin-like phospholipase family protein n=1 Tax=Georgenia alba TaxID=2233858 RepID=A0ABW2Q2G8_9MICO
MRAQEVLGSLRNRHRRQTTGLVLSGGGARSDFQIGALRYLYDRVGITPQVIVGTSAGSILASVLAQSEDPDEQRRSLATLERLWGEMRTSSDMFTPYEWFDRLRRRGPEWMAVLQKRQQRQNPLGRTFARAATTSTAPRAQGTTRPAGPRPAAGPFAPGGPLDPAVVRDRLRTMAANRPWPPAREDHGETGGTVGVVEFLAALREVGRARPDLELILRGAEREKAMYRPGPLVERLVEPEVFDAARVASSGVTLRIAVVALESGELRYVTEDGHLVDRANRPLGGAAVDLVDAVRASCAIPAVFRPVPLGEETYVDGGVRETLPAEIATDHLRVDRCYAVVASPPGVPYEDGYAEKDMLSVVLRATAGIMADEGLRDEVEKARRDGAVVIAPELNLHDLLTVDPGLTAISMDYGYLRAAEAVRGATTAQAQLTRDVIRLRRQIWQLEESLLAELATPAEPGAPVSSAPSQPDLSDLAVLKRRLRDLVEHLPADRRPPEAGRWWLTFERHAFDVAVTPGWT